MFFEPSIKVEKLGKCYRIYDKPHDRLIQMLTKGKKNKFREFWALSGVTFEVRKGECLGIIGVNGAGKSTLLQLLCGTLAPTCGEITVNGRVAALLELGAGFNPEFTGRENVFFNAALLGLSHEEILSRYDEIVEFSGVGEFIDQPVKTYSSGMYLRLAFSVATNVDPDILIIDEALSVGDGAFSRKSFDRIMTLREKGATILFCSHSMHHVESICDRACWLDRGQIVMLDSPAQVAQDFEAFLLQPKAGGAVHGRVPENDIPETKLDNITGTARIVDVHTTVEGLAAQHFHLTSKKSDLHINIEFICSMELPEPTVAVSIYTKAGQVVTSAFSKLDNAPFSRNKEGCGFVEIIYPRLALLKGHYYVSVFLLCENAIHIYDYKSSCAELTINQSGLEQGLVALPCVWQDKMQEKHR